VFERLQLEKGRRKNVSVYFYPFFDASGEVGASMGARHLVGLSLTHKKRAVDLQSVLGQE